MLEGQGSSEWCGNTYAALRREGWDHWEAVKLTVFDAALPSDDMAFFNAVVAFMHPPASMRLPRNKEV
jgi:hypothetical protein